MKDKKNQQNPNTNVEFGMEFGDLNSAKLYEISFSQKDSKSNKNSRKK